MSLNEQTIKCEQFWSDYTVYYEENNWLKSHLHQVKEQKDNAQAEINRLKQNHFTRVEELEEDAKDKLAKLHSILAQERDHNKTKESESYEVIWRQEQLILKWKHEL